MRAVRFIKLRKVEAGQECRYCDNLPVGIVLFPDFSECFVCQDCLVKEAKFIKNRKGEGISRWNPFQVKSRQNSLIKNTKLGIVEVDS